MIGFQAAGAAPLFHGRVIEEPETLASAIRIGNPASWKLATQAIKDSGGAVDIVTDQEILAAQGWLAANEGIFVEPASAAGVAGLLKWLDRDRTPTPRLQVPDGGTIAVTVTGHGLKDADTVLKRPSAVGRADPGDARGDFGDAGLKTGQSELSNGIELDPGVRKSLFIVSIAPVHGLFDRGQAPPHMKIPLFVLGGLAPGHLRNHLDGGHLPSATAPAASGTRSGHRR